MNNIVKWYGKFLLSFLKSTGLIKNYVILTFERKLSHYSYKKSDKYINRRCQKFSFTNIYDKEQFKVDSFCLTSVSIMMSLPIKSSNPPPTSHVIIHAFVIWWTSQQVELNIILQWKIIFLYSPKLLVQFKWWDFFFPFTSSLLII